MQVLLSEINLAMARDGNKVEMWRDLEKYPDLDSLTVVCRLFPVLSFDLTLIVHRTLKSENRNL